MGDQGIQQDGTARRRRECYSAPRWRFALWLLAFSSLCLFQPGGPPLPAPEHERLADQLPKSVVIEGAVIRVGMSYGEVRELLGEFLLFPDTGGAWFYVFIQGEWGDSFELYFLHSDSVENAKLAYIYAMGGY